jgi:hypothetical protein
MYYDAKADAELVSDPPLPEAHPLFWASVVSVVN